MLTRKQMCDVRDRVDEAYQKLDSDIKNDPEQLKRWLYVNIFSVISDIQVNRCIPAKEAELDRAVFLNGFAFDWVKPDTVNIRRWGRKH